MPPFTKIFYSYTGSRKNHVLEINTPCSTNSDLSLNMWFKRHAGPKVLKKYIGTHEGPKEKIIIFGHMKVQVYKKMMST
jgi:hypothetical protein